MEVLAKYLAPHYTPLSTDIRDTFSWLENGIFILQNRTELFLPSTALARHSIKLVWKEFLKQDIVENLIKVRVCLNSIRNIKKCIKGGQEVNGTSLKYPSKERTLIF